MKLALRIDDESNGSSFRPGDQLRGTLDIQGCSFKHPPRITATLWARLTVKVSPEANGCCPNEHNHILFERSKDLKIMQSTISKDKPGNFVYECPIEFKFPTSLNCACENACQLPSSIKVNDGKLQIKSTYLLSATVERRVIGKVTRTTRVKRELPFICNPLVHNLAASCTVALCADKLTQRCNLASRELSPRQRDEYLPSYSPSLQMEIILPEPPVLIRGQGTPVRLVLHTPQELMQEANVYVRSVEIQMRAAISARLRSTWGNVTDTRHGNTIKGAVPIKSEDFELDLGAWGMFVVAQSLPSLNSCLLRLKYGLDVTAGISNGLEGPIQYIIASLDVLVMDPPPSYQEAALDVR